MSLSSGVVCLGLDAFDPALAGRWMDEGRLPTLARMREEGARCGVRSPLGFFVSAIWPCLTTGVGPVRHGFTASAYVDSATYRRTSQRPPVRDAAPLWRWVSEAGGKACAIDVPHSRAEPLNGVLVAEYACHDRHHGFNSWPATESERIRRQYGLHPAFTIFADQARDFAGDDLVRRAGEVRTSEEDGALLRDLLAGLEVKARLSRDLLGSDDWRLFFSVFGESHAVGHQLWGLHDPSHPRFDAEALRRVGGDPVLQVYQALDRAVQSHLEACGPDVTVLVLLSHGMGPHYDGGALLDEVLIRLDSGARTPAASLGAALRSSPAGVQRIAGLIGVPPEVRRRLSQWREQRLSARSRSQRRFYAVPCSSVFSGVRLNLSGREAKGRVAADEAEAVLADLERELMALRNLEGGGPVLKRVIRTADHYARAPDDRLPDLLLEWSRAAPIEGVYSERIGKVRALHKHWRSGDHLAGGLLLAKGPGIPAGVAFSALDAVDFAPSIAQRLGIPVPAVEGKPADWLASPD